MRRLLAVIATLTLSATASAEPRLPVLSNADAWKRLPGAGEHEQVLPAWARMLAGPMPLTTARMLELDALHRSGDRLDARLRCLVRYAAAEANGCAYSRAFATADLRRARGADLDLAALVAQPEQLPAADRAAVDFARKMMRQAYAVTDEEVHQLIAMLGEERVMALVALLAHASFQDRILLALDPPVEPAEGIPPLSGRFARVALKTSAHPAAPAPESLPAAEATPDWQQLQRELDRQRQRPGRIRVPSVEEVMQRLGKDHPGAWQAGIVWSRVAYGYQPELTDGFFDCVNAFRQESNLGPVFSNALFWVATRSLQCFY